MSFLKKLGLKKSRKLIVIGLDGTPYTFIKRVLSEGRMPNFQKLVNEGSIRQMKSVIPTISSVAWSTYMTGKNPAKHGIFGFIDLRPGTYEPLIPTSKNMISKTLWEYLSDKGKRVVVMNVPETYPPREVNGILISGFLCTDITRGTHPQWLGEQLKKEGYRIDVDAKAARENRERILKDIDLTFKKRTEIFFRLMKKERWDYLHLHVMCTDRLFHFLWEQMENNDPMYTPGFYNYISQIDDFIGELVERIDSDTDLIILSDHGFCTIQKEIYLNHWLKEEGYLKFDKEHPKSIMDISSDSQAFSLIPGRIFIHLREKYPKGSVSPEDYETLRDEISARLMELRDPDTGNNIISRVYRKEEIYHGPALDRAADLIAHPVDGYDLKGNVDKDILGEKGVLCGMHTYHDAFLYIRGKEIVTDDFSIMDLFPTVCDMMDIQKPSDIDGKTIISH